MHCLIEIAPLDPVQVIDNISIGGSDITIGGSAITLPRPWSLSRPTLRLSSVQDRNINGLNSVKWWPGIVRKPALSMQLFDGDFSSDVTPGQASVELSMSALEKMDSNVRRFVWAGAAITIYVGDSGDAWPWTTVFAGRVVGFQAAGNKLVLTANVDAEPFSADVLSLAYAGTGGIEGGADLKGKPKPWAFGAPRNIEPVLIDSVNSVFQFSAYGAVKAVEAVYERGADFGASLGDYATYNALVAATIPEGRWGTCIAQGLIRMGAPPYGVITADVQGDYLSSTWVRLPGAIIQRACSQLGISSGILNTTSLGALDTFAATLPAGGNISLYLTEQTSVLDLAKRIALTFNAQAGISWTGQLFTTRVAIGTPAATLDAQQTRLPRVVECTETDVSPPYAKIQMGGERSWRVHTFDEIAFQAELIDKGDYSASAVYREGYIVFQPSNGARYVYINPTATSGNAPPNATYWESLQTVDPKLAGIAAGATVGAPAGTNVGSTSATTVESGANAANNGVNSDGTIKTNKVDTASMLDYSASQRVRVDTVSDITLTDGVEVTIATASITKKTSTSDIELRSETLFSSSDDVRGTLRLKEGSTVHQSFQPYMNGALGTFRITQALSKLLTGLASGSHTFTLTFQRSGGASAVKALAGSCITVEEMMK